MGHAPRQRPDVPRVTEIPPGINAQISQPRTPQDIASEKIGHAVEEGISNRALNKDLEKNKTDHSLEQSELSSGAGSPDKPQRSYAIWAFQTYTNQEAELHCLSMYNARTESRSARISQK